jgi:hypothetical protein
MEEEAVVEQNTVKRGIGRSAEEGDFRRRQRELNENRKFNRKKNGFCFFFCFFLCFFCFFVSLFFFHYFSSFFLFFFFSLFSPRKGSIDCSFIIDNTTLFNYPFILSSSPTSPPSPSISSSISHISSILTPSLILSRLVPFHLPVSPFPGTKTQNCTLPEHLTEKEELKEISTKPYTVRKFDKGERGTSVIRYGRDVGVGLGDEANGFVLEKKKDSRREKGGLVEIKKSDEKFTQKFRGRGGEDDNDDFLDSLSSLSSLSSLDYFDSLSSLSKTSR